MITVEIDGLQQVAQQLQRLGVLAEQALLAAIAAEAERILEASVPDVPVDTGLMLSTGMVERQPAGADIRFGGHGLAPYTLRQHEDTTLNHPNGGTDHWLSKALFAATGEMLQRLAADMLPPLRTQRP